jgi:hypothetical protein
MRIKGACLFTVYAAPGEEPSQVEKVSLGSIIDFVNGGGNPDHMLVFTNEDEANLEAARQQHIYALHQQLRVMTPQQLCLVKLPD